MMRYSVTLKLMPVLLCLFALAGCDRSAKERDRALAQAQKLRAELVKVQTALEEVQDERDELNTNYTITSEELEDAQAERDQLKESLAMITEVLQNSKSKLADAIQVKGDLEYQIAGLTREQNTAIALEEEDRSMIERLTGQLEEKDDAIRELEQWNVELQATVQKLRNYIEQMEEQIEVEPQEEFEEQYEEEVYDQNDI